MRTLAVPEDLLRLLSSIAQRCAKVDASCRSDYESMMVAAGKANALLAAPGVEPSHVALLESHDERRWKAVIVPPGQSLEFDDDGATRKWLWPHLGNDFHLDGFVPIETPAPEER